MRKRRACDHVGVSRRVARYRSVPPDAAPLRVRPRELAAERRRFGYRRLGYLLAREGMTPHHKIFLVAGVRFILNLRNTESRDLGCLLLSSSLSSKVGLLFQTAG
jgi:hypothetical protein